jgi:hypothetical protein
MTVQSRVVDGSATYLPAAARSVRAATRSVRAAGHGRGPWDSHGHAVVLRGQRLEVRPDLVAHVPCRPVAAGGGAIAPANRSQTRTASATRRVRLVRRRAVHRLPRGGMQGLASRARAGPGAPERSTRSAPVMTMSTMPARPAPPGTRCCQRAAWRRAGSVCRRAERGVEIPCCMRCPPALSGMMVCGTPCFCQPNHQLRET